MVLLDLVNLFNLFGLSDCICWAETAWTERADATNTATVLGRILRQNLFCKPVTMKLEKVEALKVKSISYVSSKNQDD